MEVAMTLSRRKQLLLLAAIMLIGATSSTGWWFTASPGGVRRASEALMILATGICAIGSTRQLRERKPLVLASALVSLGVLLLTHLR
jgi:hypothetical protein